MKALLLALLFVSSQANAGCGPPQCPVNPVEPSPPLDTSNFLAMGQVEVPSPGCASGDLARGVELAKAAAPEQARKLAGGHVERLTAFDIQYSCGLSIYEEHQMVWLVMAFAQYRSIP